MYEIDILRGLKFGVHTDEGKAWYDPIKPYTALEYEWVLDNVDLTGNILDCGGHHGHYAVVLGSKGGHLVVVEPHPDNVRIAESNLKLNNIEAVVYEGAVCSYDGVAYFTGQTNGRITQYSDKKINCIRLESIMPDANVIKMDIEGGEYYIFQDGIPQMPDANTWIIELHPYYGEPNRIIEMFLDAGYSARIVDREELKVMDYKINREWRTHETCILQKM